MIWLGNLPERLMFDAAQFEDLWQLHPQAYGEFWILGNCVKLPRWQQAYGLDYHFSGAVSRALSIPLLLDPLLTWIRNSIDDRLNGLLVNWYDGLFKHHIGRHRDSTINMVLGAPIVTVSFGETRIFRLRPWRSPDKAKRMDFQVSNGSVLVMPYETNLAFTHEVPASAKRRGKRVSVTIRAFDPT